MNDTVSANVDTYLQAAGGDVTKALESAISDLLDVQAEAAFRTAALDRLVSRGFIQGMASEQLAGQRRTYWIKRLGGEAKT